uniref:Uncharacterized protein n=1 Tax=Rhizophora mucronata TaxID=61149 RepID=A0A2P2N3L8_RHIMU
MSFTSFCFSLLAHPILCLQIGQPQITPHPTPNMPMLLPYWLMLSHLYINGCSDIHYAF